MNILIFNVNGLRARLKYGLEKMIAEIDADIVCFQESRAKPNQVSASLFADYNHYWSIHDKAGYAGTLTLIKKNLSKPLSFKQDFSNNAEPGRVGIFDFNSFQLINAYVPNAGLKLERLDKRIEWQAKLAAHVSSQSKPIIYCGDLNCAHKQIDVGSPTIKSGVTPQERKAFQDILDLGLVDIFRERHPKKVEYTWYSRQFKSKAVNRGMCIDKFIISKELVHLVQEVKIIQDEELTCMSDHQPVLLTINLEV